MADGTHIVFLKAAREGSMIVAANWKAAVRSQLKGRAME
jgi:hypothetical protein